MLQLKIASIGIGAPLPTSGNWLIPARYSSQVRDRIHWLMHDPRQNDCEIYDLSGASSCYQTGSSPTELSPGEYGGLSTTPHFKALIGLFVIIVVCSLASSLIFRNKGERQSVWLIFKSNGNLLDWKFFSLCKNSTIALYFSITEVQFSSTF